MSKRNLYLSNTPAEEALVRFQAALKPHIAVKRENISAVDALGRVTGQAVFARYNSPLYNCAAMDGVAVVCQNTRGASESNPLTLREGEDFLPVDTGDPIRPPYDGVIMAEELTQVEDGGVAIRAAAAPWQHVRPVGEDIVAGEMILPAGHTVRPIDVGVLLSGGAAELSVRAKSTVAILPTGTEMIELGDEIGEDSIVESNSRMFEGLVRQGGGDPTRFSPTPDEYDQLKSALQKAVRDFDMVLMIAGTSAGREDFTVHLLRELGEVVVHGVAIKPGKPVILAVVDGKPVIGLPGYPVSAYLAYQNFVAPILSELTGRTQEDLPAVKATLTRSLVSSLKHREYVRVKVGKVGDRLIASPLARGAGAAMSLVRADGFCLIDQDVEGVEAGAQVDVLLSRGLSGLERTVVSIGSHDLILDILADLMPEISGGAGLSSAHVGSMGGLLALKNGECHIAPYHLLDEASGEYNLPYLKRLFIGEGMALIKGVGRVQGIMVQKGNPLGVSEIEDLPRCSYINRQRGAGTRLLLDYKLKTLGIDPGEISGYSREAATHMAVAAAVREGGAQAGLGVLSAAKAMGLDFIPIGEEEYDFAIRAEFLELPHICAFIAALKDARFHERLDELGGYTIRSAGEVIRVDC
ncbi:MAG: molybdopterin biosynthesis protein [Oscillospiraceae bacterium]|nr:molybdopterin biosynthesis protein [Oscillospiraceae bacterium]